MTPSSLTPCPWRLEGAQPGPDAMVSQADGADPPLLLLLDRRQPIAADLRRTLVASLSSGERQRLAAYRLPADRERFLLGRGGLRLLLGAWLDLAPSAVPIGMGPHGKPHCPIGPRFNLSHSGDLILLALHRHRPVGVDVEQLRPGLDWQALSQRLLSGAERAGLERCPAARRPEAFLAAWCRLEARLKARGTGLAGLESLRLEEARRAPASAASQGQDTSPPADREGTLGRGAGDAPGERDEREEAGDAAAARESVWEVAVPPGYRAAAALAPLDD